ncbi:hypothetical protein [Bradyrhizobium sp. USDA 4451]
MDIFSKSYGTGMWGWLFRYQLGELRRAYRAAREASDVELKELEKKWEELESRVDAGTAQLVEQDEEGNVVIDWGEQAGEAFSEIEGVQRIYREAFLISLYHFWERELLKVMKKTQYKDQDTFAFLKNRGLSPDEPSLTALRLAANVAKHSGGKSADDLYKVRPDLFDTKEMAKWNDKPGHEYLLITDQVLDTFFEAVRKSGPGK